MPYPEIKPLLPYQWDKDKSTVLNYVPSTDLYCSCGGYCPEPIFGRWRQCRDCGHNYYPTQRELEYHQDNVRADEKEG